MLKSEITAMNFDRVDKNLTRSGLLDEVDLEILKKDHGVVTLVNFCTNSSVKMEKLKAQELGFNYIHLPWSAHFYKIFIPGYYNAIAEKFIEITSNPANHPVHVHCFHGRERTGMMVAIYRFHNYNYSYKEALNEMKSYGFKPHLHFTLIAYLYLYSIFNKTLKALRLNS